MCEKLEKNNEGIANNWLLFSTYVHEQVKEPIDAGTKLCVKLCLERIQWYE